jgi:hypothetical protein
MTDSGFQLISYFQKGFWDNKYKSAELFPALFVILRDEYKNS